MRQRLKRLYMHLSILGSPKESNDARICIMQYIPMSEMHIISYPNDRNINTLILESISGYKKLLYEIRSESLNVLCIYWYI